tara:strand:+ start:338 stop:589 length:252 start_codon:yes stop_codon:yes gene_type:complete
MEKAHEIGDSICAEFCLDYTLKDTGDIDVLVEHRWFVPLLERLRDKGYVCVSCWKKTFFAAPSITTCEALFVEARKAEDEFMY